MMLRHTAFFVLTVSALGTACSEPPVRVYEEAVTPPEETVPASEASDGTDRPLRWQAPPSWQRQGGGGMRVETFAIPGNAELAITTFPGDVGGLQANINRWRGQVQLPPVSETELAEVTTSIETGAGTVQLVEMYAPDERLGILGGILPFGDETWFFKMSGAPATVEAEKPAFIAFLKTLVGTASGEAAMVAPDKETPLALEEGYIPPSWEASPGSAMRLASYSVGDGETSADLGVFAFPGQAGGLAANINRWRAQLGLEEQTEEELRASSQAMETASGQTFRVVLLKAPEPNDQALLGAVYIGDTRSWFLKLTGAKPVVAEQKEPFRQYIEGLQLSGV